MTINALVTGASGFLGANLIQRLLADGSSVTAILRSQSPTRITGPVAARLRIVRGDIRGRNLWLRDAILSNVDEMWHCAALTSFNASDATSILQTNVGGTANVLRLATQLGVKHVNYISTLFACGDREGVILEDKYPICPKFRNAYEKSKWRAERLVWRWARGAGLSATVFRLPILVGDAITGVAHRFNGFYRVAKAFSLLLKTADYLIASNPSQGSSAGIQRDGPLLKVPIRIPCSEEARINMLSVDHVVSCLVCAARSPLRRGVAIHLANPNPPYARQLVESGAKFFNVHGYSWVDSPEAIRNAPQPNAIVRKLEERMLGYLDPFLAYMTSRQMFDSTNAAKILSPLKLTHPEYSDQVVARLLRYAVSCNWKDAEFGHESRPTCASAFKGPSSGTHLE